MTYLHTLETSTGDAAISGIKHSANTTFLLSFKDTTTV